MKWLLVLAGLGLVVGVIVVVSESRETVNETLNIPQKGGVMKLTSPAFEDGGMMPAKYTCDGENVSPPLVISEVPDGVKNLALVVDDLDAPGGTFVHWMVWNMPAETKEISEGSMVSGARVGKNSFGENGYGGPCPPSGTHRYRFILYALDGEVEVGGGSVAEFEKALGEHVKEKVELVGTYKRN